MANLSRWDPYREMINFRRLMDRFFDDSLMNEGDWSQPVRWQLPVDVVENEDEYVVKASLPGINPDDLNITYNNGALTIEAESRSEEEVKEERYLVRERRFGSFSRTITLPVSITANDIQANYDAGILTLRLPKAEEVKPKRIQVRGSQPVIEGQSQDRKKSA